MALSGSVSTSSYDGRHLTLSWTATQSIANNQSTISWTLSAAGGDDSYYYDGPITVKIAGTQVYYKEGRTKRYKGKITSGTKTITHGTDGSKSFSVSISAAIYTYAVNCTGSKTFTLDKIPRAATISSAPDFNDEENPVLKYSNPAGSIVTSLQACIASQDGETIYVPYRDISISGTSYTFNLTDVERETLLKACVNAASMTVKFYVKTEISGQTYRNNVAKTFSVVNAIPDGGISVSVSDALSQELLNSDSAMIKGVSDLAYTVTATPKKFATIKSIEVTNGSEKKTTATGTFIDAKEKSVGYTITDSRGFSRFGVFLYGTAIDYINPTATLKYSNVSVEGRVDLDFSGKIYSGKFINTPNTPTIEYRYREINGTFSDYITISSVIISDNTYTANTTATGLDYHKVYEIEYRITDRVTSATSNLVTINFLPKFDWGENDFNFNVPVYITDKDTGNVYDVKAAAKLANAMTNAYELDVSGSTAGTNWTVNEKSAVLIGNNLRGYFYATRKSAASGDIVNETVITFKIKHSGKIKTSYLMSFPSGAYGGTASFVMTDAVNDGTYLTFDVKMAAIAHSSSNSSAYFTVPVLLDLDYY